MLSPPLRTSVTRRGRVLAVVASVLSRSELVMGGAASDLDGIYRMALPIARLGLNCGPPPGKQAPQLLDFAGQWLTMDAVAPHHDFSR